MSVLLALSCLIIGILIGGVGVGGVLLVPALMYFSALTTHQAMATALFSFFFTGVAATLLFQRHGSMNWKMSLPVIAGSALSAYFGALTAARASAFQLNLILAAIIIATSVYSLCPQPGAALARRLRPRANTALLFGIGLFTGYLCGMTGAGGGIISIPLMLLFGYPALPSIGTAQVLQCFIATTGSASNYANGFIDFSLVWPVTLCELIGVAIGVRIAHAVPVSSLKRVISWVCISVGLFIVAQTFAKG